MELYVSLFTELLPPSVAAPLRYHLLHPLSPLQTCKRHLVNHAGAGASALINLSLGFAAENQGVAGGIALLALFAAAAVVLHWLSRLVLWWTRLALRLVSWALVAALCAWIWKRGIASSVRDAVVLAARLLGYLAVLKDVWIDEYNRYEDQQRRGVRAGTQSRGSRRND